MSRPFRFALLPAVAFVLLAAAACAPAPSSGEGPSAVESPDLDVPDAAPSDLAVAPDEDAGEPAPDLAGATADLVSPEAPDQAAAPSRDLARVDDLASPLDLTTAADLTVADLSSAPDLRGADLSPSPEIVKAMDNVVASTLAGSDKEGGVDGKGSDASFSNPTGIAFDRDGALLIAEYDGARIRRVAVDGTTTTLLVSRPGFRQPFGLVVLADGTLIAATDTDKNGAKNQSSGTLWKVSPLGVPTPLIEMQGRPRGLAALPMGAVAVVDRLQDTVGVLGPKQNAIVSIAGASGVAGFADGAGLDARFHGPIGAAYVVKDGSVVIADTGNHRIRRITVNGAVETVAGDGVPGLIDERGPDARFNAPCAIAADAAGNLYVSDVGNHRLRKIGLDGEVRTIAGSATPGFEDGPGVTGQFYGQEGIVVTSDGKTIYLTDGNNGDGSAHHRIRAIALP